MPAVVTARQAELLHEAQFVFILQLALTIPLYYAPGLRGLFGGDGRRTKFPCSLSWMTRKGLPRLNALVLWNYGWLCMARAFFKDGSFDAMSTTDWWRAAFMVQMFATGFVTVVLTPMVGPDVALGQSDALHCYSAIVYVADHFLANQFVLGVPLASNAFGVGFVATAVPCGVCQYLRADGDLAARKLHARATGSVKAPSLAAFLYLLEIVFMVFEFALFGVFLVGMTSGLQVEEPERWWYW